MDKAVTSIFSRTGVGAVVLVLFVFAVAGSARGGEENERLDDRSREVLQSMSAYMGGVGEFAMIVQETIDEFMDGGLRVQLSNVRKLGVRRPNLLAGDIEGDTDRRRIWYDGSRITLFDKAHNVYGVLEGVPGTIDGMLDHLADTYDVVFPIADLLYTDIFQAVRPGIETGTYAGLHEVQGRPCHHLVFTHERVDWQIWIDGGAQPIPRKLVITYKLEEGHPQYQALITEWKEMSLPDEVFRFENTTSAEKVDLLPMIEKIRH